jgi:hypothetical protein
MSFMAAALPSLVAGALSAFGPNAGAARKQQKLQNQVMQNQLGIMGQLRQYGNSPVGSDPMEQAMFANQRADLGAQQAQQREHALAAFNQNGMTPGATGDFLNNLNSNFTAQQMALNAQNVLGAMQQRRQSLMQSAQVGQQVPNFAPPTNGLPELFGSLAQSYAQYQEGQRQNRQGQQQMQLMQQLLAGGGAPTTPGTLPLPVQPTAPSLPGGGPFAPGFTPRLPLSGYGPVAQYNASR